MTTDPNLAHDVEMIPTASNIFTGNFASTVYWRGIKQATQILHFDSYHRVCYTGTPFTWVSAVCRGTLYIVRWMVYPLFIMVNRAAREQYQDIVNTHSMSTHSCRHKTHDAWRSRRENTGEDMHKLYFEKSSKFVSKKTETIGSCSA